MKEIYIIECIKTKGKCIVSIVCGFQSEIIAVINDQRYNAKSILNTPLIDYAKSVDFFINGEDEETAEMAIKKLYGLDQKRMVKK